MKLRPLQLRKETMTVVHLSNYNIRDLQYHVGITDTDKGIVTLSVEDTILYEVLKDYVQLVDFKLLFNYTLRELRIPYAMALSKGNIDYIKRSIYTSLMSERYRLETLIASTQFEYNPIENYYVKEKIVTSATVNSKTVIGALDTITSTTYGAISSTKSDTIGTYNINKQISNEERSTLETYNHGAVSKSTATDMTNTQGGHTDNIQKSYGESITATTGSDSIGEHTDNETSTLNGGARRNKTDTTNEVSAYNTSGYQPNTSSEVIDGTDAFTDETTTRKTVGSHNDTHNSRTTNEAHTDKDTNIYGEKTDTQTETVNESTEGYLDTKTIKTNPYEDTDITTISDRTDTSRYATDTRKDVSSEKIGEHNNNNDVNSDENKDRETRGRYGFTTTQSLIEAERKIADLNIVEEIISIVLRDLCLGVLYTW